MADHQKPAEEPLVPDQISSSSDGPDAVTPDPDRAEPIPDAEVVEDRPVPPPEPAPRPAMQEPAAPAAPPPRRSGAFIGFLTGGVIAAAGGFALARYVPDGWPLRDTGALKAQVEQQAAMMADLKTQIDALAARETPDVGAELATLRAELEQKLAALPAAPDTAALADTARSAAEAALAGLETRLAAVESRPVGSGVAGATGDGVSQDALAAYDQELQALKAAVESQSAAGAGATEELKALAAATESQLAAAAAEAEKLRAEAEAAGQAAMARAAVTRILAALDAGGPFSSAVAELTETGHEVPAVLADVAVTGVPTLPDLQRAFPDAARAALDAALKANMGESWTDRVASYLRTQTGARSLVPLEGNDPDAVLSRAEAALDAGQVGVALTELSALPDAAQPALAGWIAAATQREAASAAVAALSTAMDAK